MLLVCAKVGKLKNDRKPIIIKEKNHHDNQNKSVKNEN